MIQGLSIPVFREPRRLIAARRKRAFVPVSSGRHIVVLSLLPSCMKYYVR